MTAGCAHARLQWEAQVLRMRACWPGIRLARAERFGSRRRGYAAADGARRHPEMDRQLLEEPANAMVAPGRGILEL